MIYANIYLEKLDCFNFLGKGKKNGKKCIRLIECIESPTNL